MEDYEADYQRTEPIKQPEREGAALGHFVENIDLDQEWNQWKALDNGAETYAQMTAMEGGQAVVAISGIREQPYESLKDTWEHLKQGSEFRDEMLEMRRNANEIREDWQEDLKQTDAQIRETVSGIHERQLSEEQLKQYYGTAWERRKEKLEELPPSAELHARLDRLIDRKLSLEQALDQSRPRI